MNFNILDSRILTLRILIKTILWIFFWYSKVAEVLNYLPLALLIPSKFWYLCVCSIPEDNLFQKYMSHDRNTRVWEKAKITEISMFHRPINSKQNQTTLLYCAAIWEPFAVLTILSCSLSASQTWNVHRNHLGDLANYSFWFCRPATDPHEFTTLNGSYQMLLVHGPHWIARFYLSLAPSWHRVVWSSFFEEVRANHFVNISSKTHHQERETEGKNESKSIFCPLIQF